MNLKQRTHTTYKAQIFKRKSMQTDENYDCENHYINDEHLSNEFTDEPQEIKEIAIPSPEVFILHFQLK